MPESNAHHGPVSVKLQHQKPGSSRRATLANFEVRDMAALSAALSTFLSDPEIASRVVKIVAEIKS